MRSRVTTLLATMALVLMACSSGGATSPSAARATPVATGEVSASANVELTVFGAASLKGVLDKAKAAYETAYSGYDRGHLHRFVVGARDADRTGGAGGRLPVGGHDEPEEAGGRWVRRWRIRHLRGQQADGHRPRRPTRPASRRLPTSRSPGSRSSPPALRSRSRSTPPSSSGTWPRKRAIRPISPRNTPPTSPPQEDNVKAVVAKIELGEGDGGIVYVTDAKASNKVTPIDVPDTANVPATYAGVVVKASKNAAAAKNFLDWFAGPGGQAILSEFGFLPPT